MCGVVCGVVLCFIEKVSDVRIPLIIKTIFSGLKSIVLLSVMYVTTMRWSYRNEEKRKAEKRREESGLKTRKHEDYEKDRF